MAPRVTELYAIYMNTWRSRDSGRYDVFDTRCSGHRGLIKFRHSPRMENLLKMNLQVADNWRGEALRFVQRCVSDAIESLHNRLSPSPL